MRLCHLPTVPSAMAWHSDSVWFEQAYSNVLYSSASNNSVLYCTVMYVMPNFTCMLLQVKSISYMILDQQVSTNPCHFYFK